MPDTMLSVATILRLVREAYRQKKYGGGSRAEAEVAALNAYCSLRPDVPDAEASDAVARIIKASSEAGLIWTES